MPLNVRIDNIGLKICLLFGHRYKIEYQVIWRAQSRLAVHCYRTTYVATADFCLEMSCFLGLLSHSKNRLCLGISYRTSRHRH